MQNQPVSQKSKSTTIILWLFLGLFGAHYFYLGRIGRGILCVILLLSGIGWIPDVILWIADIIIILCGNMKDSEGYRIA